jgi:predicted enzyme related to lactoylglutathione lyase
MIKHVAFFAYPVSNIERARKFYEGVLGLRVSLNFQDTWIEYDISGATLAITTMIKELKPGAPGGFIGIEVDDIDSEAARLKSKGAVLKVDTFDTPGCRIAVFADPDGNGINLHQMKPGRC